MIFGRKAPGHTKSPGAISMQRTRKERVAYEKEGNRGKPTGVYVKLRDVTLFDRYAGNVSVFFPKSVF